VVFTQLLRNTTVLEQQIIILEYEGSCDTEHWSNDAEDSVLTSLE